MNSGGTPVPPDGLGHSANRNDRGTKAARDRHVASVRDEFLTDTIRAVIDAMQRMTTAPALCCRV